MLTRRAFTNWAAKDSRMSNTSADTAPAQKLELEGVHQKPAGERRLASMKVAVRYGGFSITKLYNLIAAEKIKAYKDGHKTMVDLDTVDAYHRSLPAFIPRRRLSYKKKAG
jgi:hypothetical protein